MAGGQVQGRRPAGRSRGLVPRWCDPAAGRAASRVTVWGYVVWGYLPGWQVSTRNSSVRVGGGGVWQLAAAGRPGAGFGSVVWLTFKLKAGGRQGLP